MGAREAFLLRVDPRLFEALQKWAADELRSVNGQIEFVLRRAVADAGRLRREARTRRPRAEGGAGDDG